MRSHYHQPRTGYYRLAHGVRIIRQEGGAASAIAICDYPLRAVRLNSTAVCLLSLCTEECSCEHLAQQLSISVKRVEALCDQLRWKGLLEAGPALSPSIWPGVSVVIPSYNRVRSLERCLRSLLDLDYPCLEIIVVDDGSTDGTSAMLQCLVEEAAKRSIVLRGMCHEKQQGVACSRNTGTASAQYDLIAYIDSDCVASADWLAELVPVFQDARVAAVGGMIRAYERHSLLGRYEDIRSSLFMGMQPQQVCLEGPLMYLPTANLLIRRALWQQLGGFAQLTFGEDVDFCRRLLLTGARIRYLPQGIVYHDYRTQIRPFLQTRVCYASAEAVLLRRHPTERRILVLPPEQATFACLAIAGLWSLLRACIWSAKKHDPHKGGRYILWRAVVQRQKGSGPPCGGRAQARRYSCYLSPSLVLAPISILAALGLTIFGTYIRLRKVREQRIPMSPLTVFKATLRGHLAYIYHLSRHLTRYYTLPLLLVGLLVPPLLLLTFCLCSIVIGVDYVRLRPDMSLGKYYLCSLLDDCAYEVGVVKGCIKCRMWRPLVPVIKKRV